MKFLSMLLKQNSTDEPFAIISGKQPNPTFMFFIGFLTCVILCIIVAIISAIPKRKKKNKNNDEENHNNNIKIS